MPKRRAQSAPSKKRTSKSVPEAASEPAHFETVRRIALSLDDDVEEGISYRAPGFRVGGVLFARLRADLDSLVLRADFDQRAELMAADPDTYYITDHYLNYEWVLVRLSRVGADALRDLLRMAWRSAVASKRGASRSGRRLRR
jgi:hypothetical protein